MLLVRNWLITWNHSVFKLFTANHKLMSFWYIIGNTIYLIFLLPACTRLHRSRVYNTLTHFYGVDRKECNSLSVFVLILLIRDGKYAIHYDMTSVFVVGQFPSQDNHIFFFLSALIAHSTRFIAFHIILFVLSNIFPVPLTKLCRLCRCPN